MNQILKVLIFSCFLLKTTLITANIAVFNSCLSDSIIQKTPAKLATDPTYPPFNNRVKKLLRYGAISFFTGIGFAVLIDKYGVNLQVLRQLLLLGGAFIFLYGGLLTIIWGLVILLARWMKSVNRRRVADGRKKVKWWFWILLALVVIWFVAMLLILGL